MISTLSRTFDLTPRDEWTWTLVLYKDGEPVVQIECGLCADGEKIGKQWVDAGIICES